MKRFHVSIVLPGLVTLIGLTGCEPQPSGQSGKSQTALEVQKPDGRGNQDGTTTPDEPPVGRPSQADDAAASKAETAEVVLTKVDLPGYAAALQKLRGKVVLVDFWATWCVPCKEQFPHSAELARTLADAGLAVVSVSLDEEEERGAVIEFLQGHSGPMTHLLSAYGSGLDSFENFVIEGGVPFFKLYDRQGKQRFQFGGIPDEQKDVLGLTELDPKLAELLAEKAEQ